MFVWISSVFIPRGRVCTRNPLSPARRWLITEPTTVRFNIFSCTRHVYRASFNRESRLFSYLLMSEDFLYYKEDGFSRVNICLRFLTLWFINHVNFLSLIECDVCDLVWLIFWLSVIFNRDEIEFWVVRRKHFVRWSCYRK